MTNEEKRLLFIELCVRIPYGVKITCFKNSVLTPYLIDFRDSTIHTTSDFNGTYIKVQLEDCKPYLRPMSSMTEEEGKELENIFSEIDTPCWVDTTYGSITFAGDNDFIDPEIAEVYTDWLNKKMFDYRGLIPMGLALEAPENMYKNE